MWNYVLHLSYFLACGFSGILVAVWDLVSSSNLVRLELTTLSLQHQAAAAHSWAPEILLSSTQFIGSKGFERNSCTVIRSLPSVASSLGWEFSAVASHCSGLMCLSAVVAAFCWPVSPCAMWSGSGDSGLLCSSSTSCLGLVARSCLKTVIVLYFLQKILKGEIVWYKPFCQYQANV